MAKKNYYAVRRGHQTGIFRTWDECKKQVNGYPGAEYKGFSTELEAEDYLNNSIPSATSSIAFQSTASKPAPSSSIGVKAYVDGSYDSTTNIFSYGMIILQNGTESRFCKKFCDSDLASMCNVVGEIKGAEAAIQYALDHGIKHLTIYHDYEGIAKWCTGEWKANKHGTIAYRNFYTAASKKIKIDFVKVTGHSGDKYNEIADSLAKSALGLI